MTTHDSRQLCENLESNQYEYESFSTLLGGEMRAGADG